MTRIKIWINRIIAFTLTIALAGAVYEPASTTKAYEEVLEFPMLEDIPGEYSYEEYVLDESAIEPLALEFDEEISAFAAQSGVIYTSNTDGNNNTGNGTEGNPYNLLSTAIENAMDGDTIVVLGSAYINEDVVPSGEPYPINKNITIQGTGSFPTLALRTAGLLLGANVTFDNISLSFENAFHPILFVNGHSVTLHNVIFNQSANEPQIVAGGLNLLGTGSIGVANNDANITISGKTLWKHIYAGGLNEPYTGNVTIHVNSSVSRYGNDTNKIIVDGCGAKQAAVNTADWFGNLGTLPEPVAMPAEYPTTGIITVNSYDGAISVINGYTETGSAPMDVNLNGSGYQINNIVLNNIRNLTVGSGYFIPNQGSFLSTNSNLAIAADARFGLKQYGSEVTLQSFSGGGGLVLDRNQHVTVSGLVTGTTYLGIDGMSNASLAYMSDGAFPLDKTYITAAGSNAGSFAVTPKYNNSMRLEYNSTDGTWTTRSEQSGAGDQEVKVTNLSFMQENKELNTSQNPMTVPASNTGTMVDLEYECVPQSSEADFGKMPIDVMVSDASGYYKVQRLPDPDYPGYYIYKVGTKLHMEFYNDALYVGGYAGYSAPIPQGSYQISVTVPAQYSTSGQAFTKRFTLKVESENTDNPGGTTEEPETPGTGSGNTTPGGQPDSGTDQFNAYMSTAPACGTPMKFVMEAPKGCTENKFLFRYLYTYVDGEYHNVVDVSHRNWGGYQEEPNFQFTFYASGTYYLSFSWMGKRPGSTSFTTETKRFTITIDDPEYPTVETLADRIVAQCEATCTGAKNTEFDKALWLHDWLVDHNTYDYSYLYISPEAVLTSRGKGICEAFHRAYSILLDRVGIENTRIENRDDLYHCWTGVKLDGKWYQVDVTWDVNQESEINMLGDGEDKHLYFGFNGDIQLFRGSYNDMGKNYTYNSLDNNYFIKTGKIKKWSDPLVTEMQSHVNRGELNFEIDLSTPDRMIYAYAENYDRVIYSLVAYQLSSAKTDWTKSSGSSTTPANLSVSYEKRKLLVTATYGEDAGESGEEGNYSISITLPTGYNNPNIYIDGAMYRGTYDSTTRTVTWDLRKTNAQTAVAYQINTSGVPTGMYVWKIDYAPDTGWNVQPLEGLQDLISYHGFAVRVSAPAGLRYKYGLDTNTKKKLKSTQGVDGYRLKEMGSFYMATQNINLYPFVLVGEKTGEKARAFYYQSNGTLYDKVLETVSGRERSANVLIDLPKSRYATEISFRAYAILEDAKGEEITVYGPVSSKSIYSVAKQLIQRGDFQVGSSGDVFLKSIVSTVEKK